jgi:pyridinium-3,5-bisthiocarboxylic acid mononucleotide nickel chelatase
MTRTLYFDTFAGISGDMTLGALLDLGADREAFLAEMDKLGLGGKFHIVINERIKHGIRGTDVHIQLTEDHPQPRHLSDITLIIEKSGLTAKAKMTALKIFNLLAEAEAAVHGTSVDDVHFHEVGAVDAIVDICGTAVLLDMLGAEQIAFGPINVGSGRIRSAHGELPVPAPATAELLKGLPACQDGDGELCTPTGAAIAAAIHTQQGPMPCMTIIKTGYGWGKRETGRPNCLRIILGESCVEAGRDEAVLLQTNVDDMPPHALGYAMEKLFEAGALDVWFTPIQMKKNRPGTMISALVHPDNESETAAAMLRHAGTLGVRSGRVQRHIAERRIIDVETGYGHIRVKATADGTRLMPEYEDCARAARESGAAYMQVHNAAVQKAEEMIREADKR